MSVTFLSSESVLQAGNFADDLGLGADGKHTLYMFMHGQTNIHDCMHT